MTTLLGLGGLVDYPRMYTIKEDMKPSIGISWIDADGNYHYKTTFNIETAQTILGLLNGDINLEDLKS